MVEEVRREGVKRRTEEVGCGRRGEKGRCEKEDRRGWLCEKERCEKEDRRGWLWKKR